MMLHMPRAKQLAAAAALLVTVVLTVQLLRTSTYRDAIVGLAHPGKPAHKPPPPPLKYKPAPTYTPPPVADPFPALATAAPPPIPRHNVAKPDAWKTDYRLALAPPLVIGFTRNWPMLLQTVVSYITAGWPAEQIYVVENTGVQQANARGQLTLQHPFYLNHTQLRMLKVNVVQTPVLLSFAQLQNFFLAMSYEHDWPYYFWSHQDVLALAHENGFKDLTPNATSPGYKSLYTLCLEALRHTLDTDDRWATRLFAYDHLTLQNPRALEDIGGWDTLIPYYMTDCDTYSRLTMAGWSQKDANCGVVTDTATVLDDLMALYRDPSIVPKFTDPNPPPPPGENKGKAKRDAPAKRDVKIPHDPPNMHDPLDVWWLLLREADRMFHHKHGGRGRNTWQSGQHGGQGEPFHYDSTGFTDAIEVLTEAGKEVFRRKWGHRDCDLGRYKIADQWKMEKDWKR